MAEADLEKLDGITNGTAAAAKALLVDGVDYAIVTRNVNGVGELTMLTDQSLNNLVVDYSPDQAEGTIGGQSNVG